MFVPRRSIVIDSTMPRIAMKSAASSLRSHVAPTPTLPRAVAQGREVFAGRLLPPLAGEGGVRGKIPSSVMGEGGVRGRLLPPLMGKRGVVRRLLPPLAGEGGDGGRF